MTQCIFQAGHSPLPGSIPDKGIRSLRGQTATSWTAQLCS